MTPHELSFVEQILFERGGGGGPFEKFLSPRNGHFQETARDGESRATKGEPPATVPAKLHQQRKEGYE